MPELEKNEQTEVKKENIFKKVVNKIFVKDWQLKLIAIGLGIFTWAAVHMIDFA